MTLQGRRMLLHRQGKYLEVLVVKHTAGENTALVVRMNGDNATEEVASDLLTERGDLYQEPGRGFVL